MKSLNAQGRVVLLTMIVVIVSACSEPQQTGYVPDVLQIGLLPDESETALKQRFAPLGQHLSEQLDLPYELVIPRDYADLVNRFGQGELDLAYFGGLTFLQAHERAAASPLVMRDIDAHFTSYFLVPADMPDPNWKGMRGISFSFGSRLSTSGHLMPRYFLRQRGIEPEDYFSEVRYSGAHDATARLVGGDVVALGAANSQIIDAMLQDERISRQDVRIFWETPPYADYVWAVRADTDIAFQQELLNTFLSLSPDNQQHAAILSSLGAGGFIPASLEDFAALREIAISVGLLNKGNKN